MSIAKAELRAEMMRRRDELPERERRGAAIRERVIGLPAYAAAQAIHCYISMRSEVDTRPLIGDALARGKRVAVPVVVPKAAELAHAWLASLAGDDLVAGSFGTFNPRDMQPAAPGEWDLAIVPLLAFDRRGYRVGYGAGYYDRTLAGLPGRYRLGVAYAAQQLDEVPAGPYDERLDAVATERGVIICKDA